MADSVPELSLIHIFSKMAIGLTILGTCIPMAGILKLPAKYPELWKNSKYAKRYPRWRLNVMVVITYAVLATQVYSLFAGNPLWANVIILVYMGCVVFGLGARRILLKKRMAAEAES